MDTKANEKSTMRALIAAVFSIIFCVVMLLGSTYAWFSSSVTTAGNIITTAGFSVVMEYSYEYDGNYTPLTNSSQLFNFSSNAPLTAGSTTGVRYIKITNNNSCDVSASVSISPVTGVGEEQNQLKLAWAVVDYTPAFTEDNYNNSLSTSEATVVLNNYSIQAGSSIVVAIDFMLPEGATAGVVNSFTITVGATQAHS